MQVLYTADQGSPAFEAGRAAVDVVCLGDSLTGWNNFGPADSWPYRTYPDFLQELCVSLGLHGIANGGIAGEISDNGPQQVQDYLALFPNARYFVMGMGTNDLGTWPDTEATSQRIIANLGKMIQAIQDRGKQPLLFNVPNANEAMFPPYIVRELRAKRDYHNARLAEFCAVRGVPLADICSRLHDEHFGDELHPNAQGAKIIAEEVYQRLIMRHQARLQDIASRFRRGIERSVPDITAISFKHFPRGSCGDASILLGRYLREIGLGYADYVSGSRDGYTHGWLEIGPIIIDITADQFGDAPSGIIVSVDAAFHDTFRPVKKAPYDAEECIPEYAAQLDEAYATIIKSIGSGMP